MSRSDSPETSIAATGTPYPPSSSPPSSPPVIHSDGDEDPAEGKEEEEEELSAEDKEKWENLGPFLEKVTVYAKLLREKMQEAKRSYTQTNASPDDAGAERKPEPSKKPTPENPNKGRKKRGRPSGGLKDEDVPQAKRTKVVQDEPSDTEQPDKPSETSAQQDEVFTQPALITGAKLKDYQLEGVAWMTGLFQNGISGILADEMGLGKTLQTIAFHAWLRERSTAPFMVVCPLSVLNNWAEEFKKFAPEIPVCVYHGTPQERAELRRTKMVVKEDRWRYWLGPGARRPESENVDAETDSSPKKTKRKPQAKAKPRGRPPRRVKGRNPVIQESSDSEQEAVDESNVPEQSSLDEETTEKSTLPPHQVSSFPVVITTYDILMKDRPHLAMYRWGFIVVDEGHRLKNMDCKLIQEIKALWSDARMILTGTPLHNNLAELWTLLNFVLPDIFTDLASFQEWFNLPTVQASASSERQTKAIQTLHTILRPFLLRRLKVDVETNLPPKKEYVLYAPLSERQRELYDAILQGGLRALLLKDGDKPEETVKQVVVVSDDEDESNVPKTRSKAKTKNQKGKKGAKPAKAQKKFDILDGDDDEYFRRLEAGYLDVQGRRTKLKTAEELGREWHMKAQLKKVNNMKLQNTVMQLRKVCSHPFLFDWPTDETGQPILNEDLVSASGKMMVLDRLLDELFKRGHKVLLFSQFTTMLDIIEDWAVEFKHWRICRIDGSTSMESRREQVNLFQNSGDAPDAPKLFLLSTRAGGLGLNLVAADTVIFYDQDWNPQMDLQAQDRAHRIGQTKPVLIFRLITAHTVETKIMQRATDKRKLEALVIAKGKFKAPTAQGRAKAETMAEMAASLLKLEGEKIEVVPDTAAGKASVISDEDLDMLLDRRPEVFADRGKGWTSAEERKTAKTAFAVYDAPADQGNDALAGMMGEPIE
ncbi:hypothetical protein K474DRAFT_1667957 [Panus rudis PR-1116 ss-1]|nr:hypothetical protein K474DRAFT_1667957 [Panus rudis PR-1116 ss-1]